MKRFIFISLVLVGCCLLFGCGNNGTSIAGNPSTTLPTITIGKLTTDGKSTITMPLAVFGDSEAVLNGARFDVYRNDTLKYANVDPAQYYDTGTQNVRFILSGLLEGDVLRFDITVQGDAVSYEGIVSDEEDSLALSTLFSYSLTETLPNMTITSRSDGSNEVAIAASAFGGIEEISEATITLTFWHGEGSSSTETFAAGDLYQEISQAVVFSVSDLYGVEFQQEVVDLDEGTGEFIYSDESLVMMDFMIELGDGSIRRQTINASTILTDDNEDYQFGTYAFVGTGTTSFSQTYAVTVQSVDTEGDCGSGYDSDVVGEAAEVFVEASQGLIGLEVGDVGDTFTAPTYYGSINDDGSFDILAALTTEDTASVFSEITIEFSGRVTSSSFQGTTTFVFGNDGVSDCTLSISYE